MRPHIQIFLKQTRRSTKRLVLQLVLLCAVTAFFAVSLNLYANSTRNLQTVEDTYSTIATMEIYGFVSENGTLVHPGDEACVGRHLLSLDDYDFSELLALNSVKHIEIRNRVGAYIPGQQSVFRELNESFLHPAGSKELIVEENVIRFVLDSNEPYTFSLQGNREKGLRYQALPIRILEQANPLVQYPEEFSLYLSDWDDASLAQFADEIRRLNGNDCTDSITLYPDVEYVMAVRHSAQPLWIDDPETGKYVWQEDATGTYEGSYTGIGLSLNLFTYEEPRGLCYMPGFGLNLTDVSQPQKAPFALHRYEDVKEDPRWTEYVQGAVYDIYSFPVVMTGDISRVAAWHQGGMYLNEGRMITQEEYASGAKVCMISATLAAYQGWKVGDKLDLNLYSDSTIFDTPKVEFLNGTYLSTDYRKDCGGFFEEDTYEIVGIFNQRNLTDTGGTADAVFHNPFNAIYIPTNAAPDAPQGPVQAGVVTIELQNGSINAFKAAVEEMGLTDQTIGEYEIKFSYFDQDYSKIQPGLMEMNHNAKLLLALSSLLLLVTMVLMSFLFAQQHKHSAGILRMLGGSKGQAFTAILACAAAVVAAGGIAGTILGGVLTQTVGASILGDTEAAVALATGASPLLTALTGLGCIVLFLLLTAIFTATYITKEPRALLPKDGV